jgi:hypothetical protein
MFSIKIPKNETLHRGARKERGVFKGFLSELCDLSGKLSYTLFAFSYGT